jgi:hypothetical protein
MACVSQRTKTKKSPEKRVIFTSPYLLPEIMTTTNTFEEYKTGQTIIQALQGICNCNFRGNSLKTPLVRDREKKYFPLPTYRRIMKNESEFMNHPIFLI